MSDNKLKVGDTLKDYASKMIEIATQIDLGQKQIEKCREILSNGDAYQGTGEENFSLLLGRFQEQTEALQENYRVASTYIWKTYDTMNETDTGMANTIQNQG